MRRTAGTKLRFRFAFVKDASVVRAFVVVGQRVKDAIGFGVAVRHAAGKLIGDGQTEQTQSCLMLRVLREYIATDRLRFAWFVQVTIELNLGNRLIDSGTRDWL